MFNSRPFYWIGVVGVALLLLVRFVNLRADFPNHTLWADDHAKFSDEGWYANAAMNSVLMGRWYLPGDWAPAAVVPAWPALLTAEFHLTGVSVVAARATEVVFSLLAIALCAAVLLPLTSRNTTLAFLLLTAMLASGYIYSRIAILERPFEFMAILCLWLALRLRRDSVVEAVVLGVIVVVMVLTKTTGVFLIPALLYPIWFRDRGEWRKVVRPLAIIFVTVAVLIVAERVFFANPHAADAKAFFANSKPHIAPFETARKGLRLGLRGTWIDPVLWPMACIGLAWSLWRRRVWHHVLWGVSALWIASYSAFIVYHYDGPPRYFTVMTLPVVILVVLFGAELRRSSRYAFAAVVALLCVSAGWNLWHVQRYVLRPEWTMADAADQIRSIIDAHPESPRMIIGHASNQTTIYNAIPSVDDYLGWASEADKVRMYNPGWALIWTDEKMSDLGDVAAARKMIPRADLPVMDDPVRSRLLLFQLLPK